MELDLDTPEKLLQAVMENMHDPDRVMTDEAVERAKQLYNIIQQERDDQGLPRYTPGETAIFTNGCCHTETLFKGDLRKSRGASVIADHLFPAARVVVQEAGYTGLATVLTTLLHDAQEDKKVTGRDILPVQKFQDHINPWSDQDGDATLNPFEIQKMVADMVDAVSKVERLGKEGAKDREGTMAASFRKILHIVMESGPRPLGIKGADRNTNNPTLDRVSEATRERTLKENELLYGPLLRDFGLRDLHALMIETTLPHIANGQRVLRAFQTTVEEKRRFLTQHLQGILDTFSTQSPDLSAAERDVLGKAEVKTTAPRITNYFRAGRTFGELEAEDLIINPLDPLFEITVLIKTTPEEKNIEERLLKTLEAYLDRIFGSGSDARRGKDHDDNNPVRRGKILRFQNPAFGGNLRFRINILRHHSRSKRGQTPSEAEKRSIDPATREEIKRILALSEGGAEREKLVFDLAAESLTAPKKTAFTPDGKLITLPRRATYLDFAQAIHPQLLIGAVGAEMTDDPLDETKPWQQVFLLDRFPDGATIRIQSCIKKDRPIPEDEIQIDPGKLLFCSEQQTKNEMRAYLKNPYLYCHPEERERRQILFRDRNAYLIRGEKNTSEMMHLLFKIYAMDEKMREMTKTYGERFLYRLASLLGVSMEDFAFAAETEILSNEKLENFSARRKEAESAAGKTPPPGSSDGRPDEKTRIIKRRERFLQRIGQGNINDLMKLLAERYREKKQWIIEATLPDDVGTFDIFVEDMRIHGINKDSINFPTEKLADGFVKGRLALSDRAGKNGPADFLNLLLKYTYRGYRIKIIEEESAGVK